MTTGTNSSRTAFPTNSAALPSATVRHQTPGVVSHASMVALSIALPVVALLLTVIICFRRRSRSRRRGTRHLFSRGISPIGDDEIATWKSCNKKTSLESGDEVPAQAWGGQAAPEDARLEAPATGIAQIPDPYTRPNSVNSTRRRPSVIVYSNPEGQGRRSEDPSARSFTLPSSVSMDKELPQTPIHARAPNARAGLTDEAIPGDDPFIAGPKRHPSRLAKLSRLSSPRSTCGGAHARTRTSRSSLRSWADFGTVWAGSDAELSPRPSHELLNRPPTAHVVVRRASHGECLSRPPVYSPWSEPPRLSFDHSNPPVPR